MTIASRKERQKEELKAKILQAAKVLFIEKGFEATSIRNIAERIEYSPTTIYLYFKDKDDIFYALHQEGFTLLNQYFKPLTLVSNPFERIKALSLAYITFAKENPEFYELMFISKVVIDALEKEKKDKKDPSQPEEEWSEGKRAFQFLIGTVADCMNMGYFKAMDPEVFAFTLWSMVHGICSLQICYRGTVVSHENRDELMIKSGRMVNEILDRMHRI
jgi:AcrR family transcriptional regulator